LQGAESKHLPPQGPQPGGPHFQSDQEHEQDHAQFGEMAEIFDLVGQDRAGGVGSHHDTGDQ
jgi:hypothetical protein